MSSRIQNLSRYDIDTLDYIVGGLPGVPSTTSKVDSHIVDDSSTEPSEEVLQLEKQAVSLANSGKVEQALELFDSVIAQAPYHASAYNNKAQALRIRNVQPEEFKTHKATVLELLNEATMLAGDIKERVSPKQASILRSAYAQKAALYMQEMRLDSVPQDEWSVHQQISYCLKRAGEYGDHTAAQMAPSYNPYAKLCGSMVQQALSHSYPDAFNSKSDTRQEA